jgi:hypothetical protein
MICEGGGSRLFRDVGSHVGVYHTSNPGGHDINLSMCRLVRSVLDIVKNRYAELNAVAGGAGLNGVIQEEMSIFLGVIVSVIVRIKVHTIMRLILSDYRYSAVLIPRPNSVKFLFRCWMQNEVYERWIHETNSSLAIWMLLFT